MRPASLQGDYDLIRAVRDAGSNPDLSLVSDAVPKLRGDLREADAAALDAARLLMVSLTGSSAPKPVEALVKLLYGEQKMAPGFGAPGYWARLAQRKDGVIMLEHADLRLIVDDLLTAAEAKVFEDDGLRIVRVDTPPEEAHDRTKSLYGGSRRWLSDIKDEWSSRVAAHQVDGKLAPSLNARLLLGLGI
jgi:hypothetical protein